MKKRTFFRSVLLASCAAASLFLGLPPGVASAQPAATVTIAPTGKFTPSNGAVELTGTYSCGDHSGFAFIQAFLRQSVGRVATITGNGFAEIPACTPGAEGTWFALIIPDSGKFRGGIASSTAFLNIETSVVAQTTTTVRLHG
jgi:Family of unknown function (DUF6299)